MENSASARPSFDDDATVDEMMEALDGAGDPGPAYRGNGFNEKAVEADQNEPVEELIAPEVLFPDDASG